MKSALEQSLENLYHEDMSGRIKTTSAFSAFSAKRAGEASAREALKGFVVRGVKANGSAGQEIGHEAHHETAVAAETRAKQMSEMNPKYSFAHGSKSEQNLQVVHGSASKHTMSVVGNPDWDEAKHPRDETGKFA